MQPSDDTPGDSDEARAPEPEPVTAKRPRRKRSNSGAPKPRRSRPRKAPASASSLASASLASASLASVSAPNAAVEPAVFEAVWVIEPDEPKVVVEPASSAAKHEAPPIIVATADSSLARMLSFALQQMRAPFRLLTSGSKALTELLEMPVGAQAPIVVLDVDLPGVDGHAILERLGVDRPDTFLILVLSAHNDESVQVRSLLAGALDHVAKPFNVRVLMAKIQRWLSMSSHFAGTA